MAAMHARALLLSVMVLLVLTAPPRSAFLPANSPLGEKFLDAQSRPTAPALSRDSLPACNEACLRRAAKFFVARVKALDPQAYSTAFETQLPESVLGSSRAVHFDGENAALDQALAADPQFAEMMDELIPGVQDSVSSVGGRQNPAGWTWEHVSSSQAGGEVGVMRLVPTYQRTPGSPWWRVIHPQPGAAGGLLSWQYRTVRRRTDKERSSLGTCGKST